MIKLIHHLFYFDEKTRHKNKIIVLVSNKKQKLYKKYIKHQFVFYFDEKQGTRMTKSQKVTPKTEDVNVICVREEEDL